METLYLWGQQRWERWLFSHPHFHQLVLRSEPKLSKWEDVFCNFEDKLPESLTRWSWEKKVPQPPISHSGKMQLEPFTIQTYENPTGFLYEKVLRGGKSNIQILVNIFLTFPLSGIQLEFGGPPGWTFSCQTNSASDKGKCLDLSGLYCWRKNGNFTDGEQGDQLAGDIHIVQSFAFYIWLLFLLHFSHSEQGPRDDES